MGRSGESCLAKTELLTRWISLGFALRDSQSAFQVWKARVNGYEEATKLFAQWDEDDNKWKSYQPLAKKMVSDGNAVALEKGLECCLAFAENCKTAPKTGGEVCFDDFSKPCISKPSPGY